MLFAIIRLQDQLQEIFSFPIPYRSSIIAGLLYGVFSSVAAYSRESSSNLFLMQFVDSKAAHEEATHVTEPWMAWMDSIHEVTSHDVVPRQICSSAGRFRIKQKVSGGRRPA